MVAFNRYRHQNNGKMGLTLVEVLIVISVISTAAAILLPAVLSIREANRRVTCNSRLANLGRALHSYEAANGGFPSAEKSQPGEPKRSNISYSAHVHLLPFLDQANIYSQILFDLPLGDHLEQRDFAHIPRVNGMPKMAFLTMFRCPSDVSSAVKTPGCNYRLNIGPEPSSIHSKLTPHGGSGAFASLEKFTPAAFRDGLSTTIAMSERTIGSGIPNRFDPKADYWYSGLNVLIPSPKSVDMIATCNAALHTIPPNEVFPYSGGFWFFSYLETTFYNHANVPNSANFDCSSGTGGSSTMIGHPGIVTARSLHSGGVNCVYMDGHTAFIGNNIDLTVWRALSTRAGGEMLNEQ